MIIQTAEELGRLIGQSEDYRAMQRARETLNEAKELGEQLARLEQLAQTFEQHRQQGTPLTDEEKQEYDRLLASIQADARYQKMVAAESNFDKLMYRVNQHIMKGVSAGSTSRIITLG